MGKTNNENFTYLLEGREKKLRNYDLVVNYCIKPVAHTFFNIRTIGRERVPKGPCIFAIHHCTFMDPVILGAVFEKKVHGWIAENVFERRKSLYTNLELIPVKTSEGETKEEKKQIWEAYQRTKAISLFWLKNTNDAVAAVNDGLAECCFDENGEVKTIADRKNHAGISNLAYEAEIPVVPISYWIPFEHRKKLLVSEGFRGWKSAAYLLGHARIPYWMYISKPLNPRDYKHKRALQEDIRRKQIEGYCLLDKL